MYENEIKKLKELKNKFIIEFDLEDDRVVEIDFQLEEYEETLQILYQIKAELEAWEVVKNKISIEKGTIAYANIRIKDWHHHLNKKEVETIKKASEVEKNECNE